MIYAVNVSKCVRCFQDTVDGRNPAPVDRWRIPFFIGSQPSKVVQDFFHPQYETRVIGPLAPRKRIR